MSNERVEYRRVRILTVRCPIDFQLEDSENCKNLSCYGGIDEEGYQICRIIPQKG